MTGELLRGRRAQVAPFGLVSSAGDAGSVVRGGETYLVDAVDPQVLPGRVCGGVLGEARQGCEEDGLHRLGLFGTASGSSLLSVLALEDPRGEMLYSHADVGIYRMLRSISVTDKPTSTILYIMVASGVQQT